MDNTSHYEGSLGVARCDQRLGVNALAGDTLLVKSHIGAEIRLPKVQMFGTAC